MGAEKWLSTDVVKNPQYYYLTDPKAGKREEVWVAPNNTLADQLWFFVRQSQKEEKDYSLMEAAIAGLKLIGD